MTEEEKPVRVEFADSTVVEALDEYVREALEAVAEVMDCRGIAKAFVSDESTLNHFTFCSFHWDGDEVERLVHTEEEMKEFTDLIAKKLEIEIDDPNIHIYEMAIKLRDK